MTYSFTGLAYLIVFFAFGYLLYRFFQYWKKERTLSSRLWLYFVILSEIYILLRVISGLFFADNPDFIEMTIYVSVFIQALIFATMAFFIIYIKFPKISPWIGFVPVLFLGLVVAILTLNISFYPFLAESGAINWGFPSGSFVLIVNILRTSLFFVILVPLIIILFQQFKISQSPEARKKSFGMIVLVSVGIIISVLDFLMVGLFKLDPIWRDVSFMVLGIILFIVLVLTERIFRSPVEHS